MARITIKGGDLALGSTKKTDVFGKKISARSNSASKLNIGSSRDASSQDFFSGATSRASASRFSDITNRISTLNTSESRLGSAEGILGRLQELQQRLETARPGKVDEHAKEANRLNRALSDLGAKNIATPDEASTSRSRGNGSSEAAGRASPASRLNRNVADTPATDSDASASRSQGRGSSGTVGNTEGAEAVTEARTPAELREARRELGAELKAVDEELVRNNQEVRRLQEQQKPQDQPVEATDVGGEATGTAGSAPASGGESTDTLAALKEKGQKLFTRTGAIREEIAAIDEQLQGNGGRGEEIEAELEANTREIKRLNGQRTTLEEGISTARKELEKVNSELASVEQVPRLSDEERSERIGKRDALTEQITARAAERDVLADAMRTNEKRINEIDSTVKELSSQVLTAADKEQLAEQRTQLEERIKPARNEIERLGKNREQTAARLESLATKEAAVRERFDAARESGDTRAANKLGKQLRDLKKTRGETARSVDALDRQIAKGTDAIRGTEKEIEDIDKRVKDSEVAVSRIAELEEERGKRSEALGGNREQALQLDEEIKNITAERDAVSESVSKSDNARQAAADLADRRSSLVSSIEGSQAQIGEINKRQGALEKRNTALKKERAELADSGKSDRGDTANTGNTDKTGRASRKDQALAQIQTDLETLDTERSALVGAEAQNRARTEALDTQIGRKEEDLSTLRQNEESIQERLERGKGKKSGLNRQLERVQGRLEEAAGELDTLQKERTELVEQQGAVEDAGTGTGAEPTADAANEGSAGSAETEGSAPAISAESAAELEANTKEIEKLSAQLTELEDGLSASRKELAEVTTRLSNVQESALSDQERSKGIARQEALTEQITAKSAARDDLAGAVGSNEKRIDEIDSTVTELSGQVLTEEEKKQLAEQRTQLEERIQSLRTDIDRLGQVREQKAAQVENQPAKEEAVQEPSDATRKEEGQQDSTRAGGVRDEIAKELEANTGEIEKLKARRAALEDRIVASTKELEEVERELPRVRRQPELFTAHTVAGKTVISRFNPANDGDSSPNFARGATPEQSARGSTPEQFARGRGAGHRAAELEGRSHLLRSDIEQRRAEIAEVNERQLALEQRNIELEVGLAEQANAPQSDREQAQKADPQIQNGSADGDSLSNSDKAGQTAANDADRRVARNDRSTIGSTETGGSARELKAINREIEKLSAQRTALEDDIATSRKAIEEVERELPTVRRSAELFTAHTVGGKTVISRFNPANDGDSSPNFARGATPEQFARGPGPEQRARKLDALRSSHRSAYLEDQRQLHNSRIERSQEQIAGLNESQLALEQRKEEIETELAARKGSSGNKTEVSRPDQAPVDTDLEAPDKEQAERVKQQRSVEELDRQIAKRSDAIRDTQKEIEAIDRRLADSGSTKGRIAELEQERAEQSDALQSNREQAQQVEEDIKVLSAERDAVRDAIATSDNAVQSAAKLEDRRSSLVSNIDRGQAQVADLNEARSALEKRNTAIEAEQAALTTPGDTTPEVTRQNQAGTNTGRDASDTEGAAQADAEAQRAARVEALDTQIGQKAEQFSTLRQEEESIREQLQRVDEENKGLQKELGQAQGRIEDATGELGTLQKERTELVEQQRGIKDKLTGIEAKREVLVKERDAIQAGDRDAIAGRVGSDDEIDLENIDVSSLTSAEKEELVEELGQEVIKADRRIVALNEKEESLEQKSEGLTAAVAELDSIIGGLESRLQTAANPVERALLGKTQKTLSGIRDELDEERIKTEEERDTLVDRREEFETRRDRALDLIGEARGFEVGAGGGAADEVGQGGAPGNAPGKAPGKAPGQGGGVGTGAPVPGRGPAPAPGDNRAPVAGRGRATDPLRKQIAQDIEAAEDLVRVLKVETRVSKQSIEADLKREGTRVSIDVFREFSAGADLAASANRLADDVRSQILSQFTRQGDASSVINAATGGLNSNNIQNILALIR